MRFAIRHEYENQNASKHPQIEHTQMRLTSHKLNDYI